MKRNTKKRTVIWPAWAARIWCEPLVEGDWPRPSPENRETRHGVGERGAERRGWSGGHLGTEPGLTMTERDNALQATIGERIELSGIGVHSGSPVTLHIHPAEAGTGILFARSDLEDAFEIEIPARHTHVCATELCTVLGDLAGSSIATVEHLLAALSAFGIDNALIETDGGEIPIMDGSSAAFVTAIRQAGVKQLPVRRRFIKVLKPVRVEQGLAFSEITPYAGFHVDVEIDFEMPVIGRQRFAMDVNAESFEREVSRARTFGFMSDVERLWAGGFALGASLDNTVVLGEDRVVNPEGTRFADEFARHKALDAIGDLALAGAPLLGCFRSRRGGHRLNYAALSALLADTSAWTFVEGMPRRKASPVQADIGERVPMPAHAPDVS
jgi:UDP-3-O-[3-hydroxymyristoyl] N-acetylglucosamine deacetylase